MLPPVHKPPTGKKQEERFTTSLPKQLAMVPENARITEAFGWSPSSWACALVLWCSLLFTQPAKPTRGEYWMAAAAFAFSLFLVFVEFRRRRSPTVLVRLPESLQVGIYKRGLLDRTVLVEKVEIELRHPGAALSAVIAPAVAAFGLAIFLLPGPAALSRASRIDVLLGSLCFASLAASSIKTGWFCDFCLFPYETKQGRERILVPRTALPQLLSRPPKPEILLG